MKKHIVDLTTGSGKTVPLNSTEQTQRANEIAAWEAAANDRAFARLRADRNAKLAETDWRASSDLTMSDDWKTYRQTLRDLPANTADPANPVWPDEPS